MIAVGPGLGDLVLSDLDPSDAEEFAAFHAVYDAAQRFGREDLATPWSCEELRRTMTEPSSRRFRRGVVGRVGAEVVAVGLVEGPLLDNLSLAEVAVYVSPGARRRGYGSAVLARCEAVAREHGRTTVTAFVDWPIDGHPAGEGAPPVEFARRHGFTMGLAEVQRRLRLPVADDVLDRLATEAAHGHPGYTLCSWVGGVPDELLQGWAEVTASLMTEAPMGEIAREPEKPDPAAVREAEALAAAQGRELHSAAALDAHGTVVAYSEVAVSAEGSGRAYQQGTLVRAEHRGHRLGLAVKVANLRALQAARPDLLEVVTWNAEVNTHMIAVNEQIGFVATERSGEMQKQLGAR